jgi:hypothetical protein
MGSRQVNIVLNNLKDLNDLLNGYKFFFLPREGNIKLEFGKIDESEKSKWQNKLQQYYFACGCKEGSMSSIIFFVVYWLYIIIFEGIQRIMNWEVWALSIVFLFSGAVIGKAIGLIYSRYALIIAIRKLILAVSRNS